MTLGLPAGDFNVEFVDVIRSGQVAIGEGRFPAGGHVGLPLPQHLAPPVEELDAALEKPLARLGGDNPGVEDVEEVPGVGP